MDISDQSKNREYNIKNGKVDVQFGLSNYNGWTHI